MGPVEFLYPTNVTLACLSDYKYLFQNIPCHIYYFDWEGNHAC